MLPTLVSALRECASPSRFAIPSPQCLRVLLAGGCLLVCSHSLRAGTVFGFPKDAPAFTFELPDNMQAEYQADGKLACTAKDGSLLKGVFQALPNVHDDKGLRFGLNRLIKLVAPNFLTTDLRYPAPFDQDTASGVHTVTVAATGRHDGQDSALALIVFPKNGKYYELITSGALNTMTACNFPHSFRETMQLTP